jgi:sialate O-acetylesterase
LSLGQHDSFYEVFINGKSVARSEGQKNPVVTIPAGSWKKGQNILLIKLAPQKELKWFGLGFIGDPEDFYIEFAGAKVPLAGGGWKFMASFDDPFHFEHLQNNVASSIFNAMIKPIVPYPIRGVLWYQGESNAGRAKQYQTTFPALIQNWRQEWSTEFPFYFVQLSSYGPTTYSNEGSAWAEAREAQTSTLKLPKTGMVVTTDVGNAGDIHPRNKKDVGKRLSFLALNRISNVATADSGPVFKAVEFQNSKAILTFDHVENGFLIKDNYGYIKGFEVAGEDQKFYFAQGQIVDGKIHVWSDKVAAPVAVRYAWSDAPIDANVFNAEGLPLGTFRTDTWKGVTDEVKFR